MKNFLQKGLKNNPLLHGLEVYPERVIPLVICHQNIIQISQNIDLELLKQETICFILMNFGQRKNISGLPSRIYFFRASPENSGQLVALTLVTYVKAKPGRSGASRNWVIGLGLWMGVINLSIMWTMPLLARMSAVKILAPFTVNTWKKNQ